MAGLVRTTESLLGSQAEVTLPNDKVLRDPHFLKMSVAAERALRVISVPEGERLVAYLREKRRDGMTIVALEQTSTSLLLNKEARLPERMVLLLGNEQQGLPNW